MGKRILRMIRAGTNEREREGGVRKLRENESVREYEKLIKNKREEERERERERETTEIGSENEKDQSKEWKRWNEREKIYRGR